jgi:hypothetical protein
MKTYKILITTLICVIIIITHACKKENSIQQTANYKADIVPEELARKIAERLDENFTFISNNKNIKFAQPQQVNFPIPNRQIVGSYILKDKNNIPALYIYNYANDSGFVVISAEMKHEPICAYITRGEFIPKDHVPSMFANWFGKTVENVEILRDGLYNNKNRAKVAWEGMLKNTGFLKPLPHFEDTIQVCPDYFYEAGPLLTTRWGQGCTYNDLCPSKSCSGVCGSNTNAWTGCVATAMAQVIRYWKPANKYGYNYTTMPNDIGNIEVQKLMRDCGLPENVDVDYECTGSSASSSDIPSALKRNFGFTSATLQNYNPGDMSIITGNLGRNMPVLLDGCAARSGLFGWSYDKCHEWVCDGYREYSSGGGPDDCFGYRYIHMNWGWSGNYDGWFNWNDWNVPGVSNFQYARGFIYNIHP